MQTLNILHSAELEHYKNKNVEAISVFYVLIEVDIEKQDKMSNQHQKTIDS